MCAFFLLAFTPLIQVKQSWRVCHSLICSSFCGSLSVFPYDSMLSRHVFGHLHVFRHKAWCHRACLAIGDDTSSVVSRTVCGVNSVLSFLLERREMRHSCFFNWNWDSFHIGKTNMLHCMAGNFVACCIIVFENELIAVLHGWKCC
jgi:hypothetical protein